MKRKEELQKELKKIEAEEQEVYSFKVQKLLDEVKTELNDFKKLLEFTEKGKVNIEIKYEVFETTFHYDNLFESEFEIEGGCYTNIKEQKGYQVAQFVSEKYFGNLGIEDKKYLAKVSPKFNKFIQEHEKCRKKLINKASKVGEKLGFTKEEINDILLDNIWFRHEK